MLPCKRDLRSKQKGSWKRVYAFFLDIIGPRRFSFASFVVVVYVLAVAVIDFILEQHKILPSKESPPKKYAWRSRLGFCHCPLRSKSGHEPLLPHRCPSPSRPRYSAAMHHFDRQGSAAPVSLFVTHSGSLIFTRLRVCLQAGTRGSIFNIFDA